MKLHAHVCLSVLVFAAGRPLHGQVKIELAVPLEQLESDARLDSADANALYELGLGYWSKRRLDDAERALRRAVTIDPQFAAAYLALAYAPFARRPALLREMAQDRVPRAWRERLDASARLGRRAFLLDPLVDVAILGAALQRTGAMPRGGASNSDPFVAYISGDYQWTFTSLSTLIQRVPGMSRDSAPTPVLWYRGLAAAHLGRFDVAIDDLTVLLRRAERLEQSDTLLFMAPRTNEFRYFIAFFHYKAQRFAQALSSYQEALGHEAGLYMAHVQMGRIFQAHEMWDEAVAQFQHAVASNPEDASILLELALAQWELGQIAEAASSLQQARQVNPLDARPLYFLGRLQLTNNDSAAARESLRRFLSLAPRRLAEQIDDARQRLARLP